jgi:Gas vesicle protein K
MKRSRGKGPRRRKRAAIEAKPVSTAEFRALQKEIERRLAGPKSSSRRKQPAGKAPPLRWNPDPDDVQRSVAQLVLTLVEFIRQLMERQAIRRMEARTLTKKEVEAVGLALMRLEETIRDIGKKFGLTPEDLKLDLGPIKLV